MAKIKLDLNVLEKITRDDLNKMAKEIVDAMIENTEKGISSVIGGGSSVARFPQYKDPKKYPADLKQKRPVNLKLTGAMLDSFKVDVILQKKEKGFRIKITDEKYPTHHLGLNGVPQRKIVPYIKGESLSRSLQLKLSKLWKNKVKEIVDAING